MKTPNGVIDPRFIAAVNMIERTGAETFQIRFHDDEKPVVWMAVAIYADGKADVGAGLDPLRAMFRLCDQLIDGGECKHCGRPTGFSENFGPLPLDKAICWYQWDPERKTFRRGCE